MSTYINPANPRLTGSFEDCPVIVAEFLNYSASIRGLSPRTVNAYYIDLRTFFKFLILHRSLVPVDTELPDIDIRLVDLDFIKKVNKAEIYEFLYYVTRERDNAAATRARKLSSLRGFFKYMTSKTNMLSVNPVDDIESPANKKRLPKYLTLDESLSLLKNIQSDFYERDFCMITLFLNCGMRLVELVNINVTDIKEDTIRIVGKGNKERIVYLNNACLEAMAVYLPVRASLLDKRAERAMFISRKTRKRLSARRVQQIVAACLKAAGLDGMGYSVHKLRHTAATLMYQYGNVDMLALKEILGHVDVSTTQIYTHLNMAQLKDAAAASPLANIQVEKAENQDVENSVENVENSENKK